MVLNKKKNLYYIVWNIYAKESYSKLCELVRVVIKYIYQFIILNLILIVNTYKIISKLINICGG